MMDQAINQGRSKDITVNPGDLTIAEGSMRDSHDGASFIPIEEHLGAKLALACHRPTAQSTMTNGRGVKKRNKTDQRNYRIKVKKRKGLYSPLE
jgi:hypothetical protein